MKKKWVYWLLSIALVACVYLVVDRTRERTVGQVCPELKEVTACTVSSMPLRLIEASSQYSVPSKTFLDEELEEFIRLLSQTPCRRENKGSVWEGRLYHVFLYGEGGELKDINMTSTGYMEIGLKGSFKAYSFQPGEICEYLDSMLEPAEKTDIIHYPEKVVPRP